ncbi:MAG: hypothetical protein KZQ66_04685 [Candidatus Thiodiazotropha sp. (ex Lucinoma aequizonata)]|nr:hypothetical protein [Candidatus Thiodiazotropha sp. (ex Lucinoma aequizonata)]MCU7899690.1 hypothetical protein [Candidatus Thiodiazotropha sp. (ex Lucinoma aequizonata)]MCU7901376.1 hypothetical protein [Candidatus Thiodiazotropha sp. (ex Lucinoma aequizonata)]MCU7908386.1 hypothetical protein [Candidatus Thiodiazotropha sp. (ex Lucinoma aequizonata)]
MTAYCAPTVLRTSQFRIALPQQAARALLHHDYRNDSTVSRMRSLYALHLSLSVAIPAIQLRLRLSGTSRLRSAFHDGQQSNCRVHVRCGTNSTNSVTNCVSSESVGR